MTDTLLRYQDEMRRYVLAPVADADALRGWFGSTTSRAIVYRNNVIHSLCEALSAQFPAVRTLVGEQFFGALARDYVLAHPPTDASLTFYGDTLPAFVDANAHCAPLPWLGDLARLELARQQVLHAPDQAALDAATIAARDIDALLDTRVLPRPATALLHSRWPVHRLHASALGDGERVDMEEGEVFLLLRRQHESVHMLPLRAATFAMMAAFATHETLLAAWDVVQAGHGLDDTAFAPLFTELLALEALALPPLDMTPGAHR